MKKKYIWILLFVVTFGVNIHAGEMVLEPSGYLPVKSTTEGPVSKFFVKYDLPDSLNGKLITLAFLELKPDLDTSITEKVAINVSPLTEEWTSSALAEVKNNISKNDTLITYQFQRPGNTDKLRFDVTIPVMKWVEGNFSNNGFVVRMRDKEDYSLDASKVGDKVEANLRIFYETIPGDRPE
ncbi:MAG: hypothetical protein DRP46_00580 [Candidatus Zixiibacteriota bacterium]|nr:MAG: hypothetical protein DRP46_00580 [candidate division Zixibacteria bacterium]